LFDWDGLAYCGKGPSLKPRNGNTGLGKKLAHFILEKKEKNKPYFDLEARIFCKLDSFRIAEEIFRLAKRSSLQRVSKCK
jgi:hypothetical protein